MSYTVIDFETTGLDSSFCEVIEFGAVQVHDGEIGLHLASLCCPKGSISSTIKGITGITNEMVRGYPPFEEFVHTFVDFIGDDTVVAHNASFDMGFLHSYCRRLKIGFHPKTLCTVQLARRKLRGLNNYKLQTVAEYLGVSDGGYHRALGDAMTTARILTKLLTMNG